MAIHLGFLPLIRPVGPLLPAYGAKGIREASGFMRASVDNPRPGSPGRGSRAAGGEGKFLQTDSDVNFRTSESTSSPLSISA